MGTAVAVVVIMTTCMSMTVTVTLVMSMVIVLAMTMATSLGGGVLPYIGYTGMCCWKGCGFQAIYSGIETSNHRKLI